MTYTYKQAFDMITEAYIKDEIKPYESEFCFCGTLHGGRGWQSFGEDVYGAPYTHQEYKSMEWPLLVTIVKLGLTALRREGKVGFYEDLINLPEWEEILFKAMSNSLEVLKQIHIERGEQVDDIEFKPRFQSASSHSLSLARTQ